MKWIRFFEKDKPRIHRYVELPEQELLLVWEMMKKEDAPCVYEREGKIEYPRAGLPYDEVFVEEAELFEDIERGWETPYRQERKKAVPLVGEILEKYPPDKPTKVIFTIKPVAKSPNL